MTKTCVGILGVLLLSLSGCQNRNINEGDEFRMRELNENYQEFHFNKITYDGVDYLITERDNNNPHEGFGFMAFNAEKLYQKQDSIMAYLATMAEIQKRMYARMYNLSEKEAKREYDFLFSENLNERSTLPDSPAQVD